MLLKISPTASGEVVCWRIRRKLAWFSAGALHPGDQPGLGVDIDEAFATKHPYKRAYLPINRLEDGTMTNW